MNIFVLSEDPVEAARFHCDKHVVKMVSETAQMLSNTIRLRVPEHIHFMFTLCRPSHVNHGCSVWMRETYENYRWSVNLLSNLIDEYDFRYGKPGTFVNARQLVMQCDAIDNEIYPAFDRKEQTPFYLAMPDKYKQETAVESYRTYYREDKARFAKWKLRGEPAWWNS